VVINDGSTDNTLETVISAFNLHRITYPVRERLAAKKVRGIYFNPDIPRLYLIDKENGGKSDALNAGINFSRFPYIVSLDADTIVDPDALLRIAMAFVRRKYTIAVGGVIRVANGCTIKDGKIIHTAIPKKIWPLLQVMEYIRTFLVGRIGWNTLNSLLVISGAFGAFQKEVVLQVGGYTVGIVGEDMDLVVKLHRYMRLKKYKYRVNFLPDPVCWTQVPDTLDILSSQRRRWQIGLIDVMSRYRDMFLNSKYGAIGMVGLPHFFIFEMLSPVIELLGYILIPVAWYFGLLSLDALLLFFTATFVFGMVTSIGSLVVESFSSIKRIKMKEILILSVISIVENLFYRQITVFFRLQGILRYNKMKNNWGVMRHQKFSKD
jgi:cellulose synthase/poly-beta-1,6-N-acetylglucosamine synthase-like glycosyltransferase